VIVGGVDHCLLRDSGPGDYAAAEDAYHQLRVDLVAARQAEQPELLTLGLAAVRCLRGLAARSEAGEITSKYYRAVVECTQAFVDQYGDRVLSTITAQEITGWLYSQPWSQTTRSITLSRLRQIWAAAQVRFPSVTSIATERREEIPTPEQFAELLAALESPECRDLLRFIAATGCRPGEAYTLTAEMIDWSRGVAVRTGKTTRKTGHKRVIYLPPEWLHKLQQLAEIHPIGPLFRSPRGRVWTTNNVFRHIHTARAGRDWPWATPYALRHLFITEALRSHVPIAHVAALVGHVDTSMISRVYSHLTRHDADLHAALAQAGQPRAKPTKRKRT
jgi:hypothetical protein